MVAYTTPQTLLSLPVSCNDREESPSCTPSYITRASILKRVRNRQTRRF